MLISDPQQLQLTRATKNTYRFDVADEKHDTAPVTALYVRRSAFKGDPPETVSVTIEAA